MVHACQKRPSTHTKQTYYAKKRYLSRDGTRVHRIVDVRQHPKRKSVMEGTFIRMHKLKVKSIHWS
jgi:hypothetical protein